MVQSGTPPTEVARQLMVGASSVFNWMARYRSGGWGGLGTGSRSGRPKKLDGAKMKFVFDVVTNKNPLQLNFAFALWTCELIAKVIKDEFGVVLRRWSVSRLLKQMGLASSAGGRIGFPVKVEDLFRREPVRAFRGWQGVALRDTAPREVQQAPFPAVDQTGPARLPRRESGCDPAKRMRRDSRKRIN